MVLNNDVKRINLQVLPLGIYQGWAVETTPGFNQRF